MTSNSRYIYLIVGSTGEYSDHREWFYGAYEIEARAQDECLRLTKALEVAVASRDWGGAYGDELEALRAAVGDPDSILITPAPTTRFVAWR